MKRTFRREHQLLLAVASVCLNFGAVWADEPDMGPSESDNSGLAILSNATNVTHWGLGVGAGLEQMPYKGYGTKFSPVPLISFDDKWVHVFGDTVDLKIGRWNGVSVTLRGEYAFDSGYKQSDAPILNGMQKRNSAFWYGPAIAWRSSFGTISGSFLAGGNKGQKAEIDFSRSFDYGNFSFEPHVGAEWLSNKFVDYYYGVRPSEVRAGRPAYTGKSTYDVSAGVRMDYHITHHQMVLLNLGVSHLGSGITNSPLVGKKTIPEAMFGYLYQFN